MSNGGDEIADPVIITVFLRHEGGVDIDTFHEGAISFFPGRPVEGAVIGLLGDAEQHATLDLATSTITLKPRMFKSRERLEFAAIARDPQLQVRMNMDEIVRMQQIVASTRNPRSERT